MEANLVRILLLIALFFLLSSDYSSVIKQLVPTFEDGEEDSEHTNPPTDIVAPQINMEKIENENRNLRIAEDTESK